jgi:hypothetical protein
LIDCPDGGKRKSITALKEIIKILSISILILVFITCTFTNTKKCEIKEIKTLFTTIGIHDRDTGYGHFTLIKDFARECMDSTTMVDLALKYCDTVRTGKPVDVITPSDYMGKCNCNSR